MAGGKYPFLNNNYLRNCNSAFKFRCQGRSQKKIMTKARSMLNSLFLNSCFRLFLITIIDTDEIND